MFAWCKRTAEKRSFQFFILVIIVLNAGIVGVETWQNFASRHEHLFDLIHHAVQVIFVVELLIRLLGAHPDYLRFFKNGWNLFDVIVVALSFVPSVEEFAMVARLARVLRVTRLAEFSWEIRLVADTMIRSIPSMGHVVLMLGLLVYIYAVLGVHWFGGEWPNRFGNLGLAAWTMFQTLTFENWVGVQDPIVEKYPWAWLYFFSFIILGVFVGINLFVAVVMNNLDEVKAEHQRQRKLPENVRELLTHVEGLKEQLEDLQKALEKMGEKKSGV